MARDSSPFAQRLRALTGRSGRPADADPSAVAPTGADSTDLDGGQPQADAAEPPQPHADSASSIDETPPDEQPTGEFPAIGEAEPEPDAGAQSDTETDSPTAPPEPEPFHYEPAPAASQDSEPAPDPAPPVSSWPVPPPIKPGMSPWLEPDEADVSQPAADATPAPPTPSPIWLDPPSHEQAPPSASTGPTPPAAGSVSDETFAPALPTPDDAYDAPAEDPGGIAPPDGPTLAPPDLSFRGESEARPFEPSSSNDDAASPSGDAPATDHPQPSTPDALNAAMALPSDDEPQDAFAQGASDEADAGQDPATALPEAEAISAAADDQPDDAATDIEGGASDPGDETRSSAPSADSEPRRGLFGRRRSRAAAQPEHSAAAESEADDADGPISATVAASATAAHSETGSTDGTAPANDDGPVDAETSADGPVVADTPADAATSEWVPDRPDAESPDPGSITGRFAAIGRRAKALTSRSTSTTDSSTPADAEPDAGPMDTTTPSSDADQAEGAVVADDTPAIPKPSFAERSALRRRVKTLRVRRDAGLLELGAIVVDQSRFGDPTGGTLVRRRARDLGDLDTEIASIEDVLDQDRSADAVAQLGVVHCTNCSTLVGPADGFCAHCGTPRAAAGVASGTATPQ